MQRKKQDPEPIKVLEPMDIFKLVSYKKVLVYSVLAIVAGGGVAGFLLPKVVRLAMRMQLRVTPGTMTRGMFEKVPFPLVFRLYVFNITNPDEVMSGGKPKLQEIGPYYFEEYKDKIEIIDNKEDDTMEYDYRNTYYYKPENNGPGLTGNEYVITAHPLLLAMIMAVHVEREELLPFIQAAIKGLLHDPKDIFFRGRAWDLFYDGIDLDCSSDAFEVTAVCSEFDSGDYKEIRRINETAFNFSMFGNSNGSSIGRFKVLRGKKNIRDLGRVLEFNGVSEMDAWYEDECNQLSGTDGTIFPPFHEKEEGFDIFIPQMCRTFHATYVEPSKYDGIKTNRFTVTFDVSKYGTPNCYCRDPDQCPPEGLLDLFPCVGTPFAVSAPHFYLADPMVLEKVEGLKPEKEKHQFILDFYQYAGAPLSAMGRAQINVEIVPIESVEFMKDLQPMYLPIAWFEDGVDLEKKFTDMLKYQLILAMGLIKCLMFGGILGGLAGIAFGAVSGYIQLEEEETIIYPTSAGSQTNLTKPNVRPIEVISNE